MSYYRQSSVPKISPVNTVIIVINVLVFLYMILTGNIRSTEYMYNHGASFWPAVIMTETVLMPEDLRKENSSSSERTFPL